MRTRACTWRVPMCSPHVILATYLSPLWLQEHGPMLVHSSAACVALRCVCVCKVCVVPAVVTVKVSSVGVSQASQLWPGAKEPSLSHLCLAAGCCWPRSTAAHRNDSRVRAHLSPVAQIHTHTQHVLTDTAHNTNLRTHKHISRESHISPQSEMSHRHSTHALSTSTSI